MKLIVINTYKIGLFGGFPADVTEWLLAYRLKRGLKNRSSCR
jgi:hypothetical protein